MFQNYLAHKTAERISEYVLHGHTVKCMCTYPVTHYKAILRFQKVLLHTQKGGGAEKDSQQPPLRMSHVISEHLKDAKGT